MKKSIDNFKPIKAPYPWFGGKSKITDEVWKRFGKTDRYIEPFFGSGAMLLANPHWEEMKREIINDLDNFVPNFWRAIKADPDVVAYYADHPVFEIDLHLRHLWLVTEGKEILKQCEYDLDFFDAKSAGYWACGIVNWIGSKFAQGSGSWTKEIFKLAAQEKNYNIKELKKLAIRDDVGVPRTRPELSVYKGIKRSSQKSMSEYLQELSNRFKNVDVCCGDWSRVTTKVVLDKSASVFLDPPYSDEAGRLELYNKDDFSVAKDVREWCISNGNNPNLRIALCGYNNEGHCELFEKYGWSVYEWKATNGYSGQAKSNTRAKENRVKECIWFSPYCLPTDNNELVIDRQDNNKFIKDNMFNNKFVKDTIFVNNQEYFQTPSDEYCLFETWDWKTHPVANVYCPCSRCGVKC